MKNIFTIIFNNLELKCVKMGNVMYLLVLGI